MQPATQVESLPLWLWPKSAYVHVPFCAHHCGYCDFAIATGKDDRIDDYLDALAMELTTLERPQSVRTLFIGGGTPTHLSVRQLERLLDSLAQWFPLEIGGEFSIECNPDSLSAEKIDVLADRGVSRVSLGAQSFHPHLLQTLEREHDAAEIPRAVERVRRRIDAVSLDLIFGVPGQSAAQWSKDLEQALALSPQHLSTYGLTYEKGTPLWKERQRGKILPLGEEEELALYEMSMDVLQAAGYEHYEISNFALPGYRCRHNEVYWANHAYFGFGMGAARYVMGYRELNARDLMTYLQKALMKESTTWQSEKLSPEERARETMAIQLRRAEGIERIAFRIQTGFDVDSLAETALRNLTEQGFLLDDGASIRLSRRGKYVADSVVEKIL